MKKGRKNVRPKESNPENEKMFLEELINILSKYSQKHKMVMS